jgi:hypothetical protein
MRRTMFSTSNVQPRWATEISFNGLTRRNCSRTSFSGETLLSVTTEIRASTGTRFRAMLQPIQPARRAVGASGLRLMMAEGGKAKLGTSRRFLTRHVTSSYYMK